MPGTPAIVRANPALPAELSLFLTGINQLGGPADAVFNGFDSDFCESRVQESALVFRLI